LPNVAANASTVSVVTTLVFQVIALIATLFIVWGGITYSRSNGDPGAIKQAKETIIYALLGLIITLFAQAIVGFVLGKL
jgi:TRAP-type C4-dicarboxylate transport system permease small subunit